MYWFLVYFASEPAFFRKGHPAGVYEEQASGANLKRPELQRLVNDIQPGDVIVAERMDRISRAPLPEAEALIATLQKKGAKLVVPGYVDLSEIQAEGMARVVLDTMQQMLLRMALQAAREDYELRRERQAQGIELAKQQGKYKGKQPDTERLCGASRRTVGR